MKTYNVDIESITGSGSKNGMTEIEARLTVTENTAPAHEFSNLNMSEATMRRLHEVLGRHIRAIDKIKAGT